MLWYCAFTWHPGTRAEQVRKRILELHDAGARVKDNLKGWYNLAGGGAGFLLLDADNPARVSELLTPYMDLMAWDVRAIYENEYDQTLERFRSMG